MRRTRFALLCSLATGVALGASACVLGDFTVAPPDQGPGADGAAAEAGAEGSVTPGTDADGKPSDSGLVCPASMGDCDSNKDNGCETDLRVSTAHCGACGRDCGAAGCENGECKEEPLATALLRPFGLELAGQRLIWHQGDTINGCRIQDCSASKAVLADVNGVATNLPNGINSPRVIAVDGSNFYFSQCPSGSPSDCSVARCDVAGCKLTGATMLRLNSGNRRSTLLVGAPGAIYTHQGLDGLIRYNLPAGPFPFEGAKWKIGDQLQAFDVGAAQVLWLDDNASMANPIGGLFACPPTGCVGAPTRLVPPPVKHLAVQGAFAYTASGTASTSSLVECNVAGCGSAGTILATSQAYVGDIAADGAAVYWSIVGAQNFTTNTAPIGAILRCDLPGCPGGPKVIASNRVNPTSVRIDATHVYWVEVGLPTSPTGRVLRRRR